MSASPAKPTVECKISNALNPFKHILQNVRSSRLHHRGAAPSQLELLYFGPSSPSTLDHMFTAASITHTDVTRPRSCTGHFPVTSDQRGRTVNENENDACHVASSHVGVEQFGGCRRRLTTRAHVAGPRVISLVDTAYRSLSPLHSCPPSFCCRFSRLRYALWARENRASVSFAVASVWSLALLLVSA